MVFFKKNFDIFFSLINKLSVITKFDLFFEDRQKRVCRTQNFKIWSRLLFLFYYCLNKKAAVHQWSKINCCFTPILFYTFLPETMGKLSKQNVSTIKEAIFSYVATLVETKLSHSNFFKFSLQLCALIMNTIGQN